MGSCFRSKRKSNFLWRALISALFVFCSLFIYYSIIYKDFTCLFQSSCLTVEEPRTSSLQDEKCRKICLSKECLKISNRILSNMDPSTEPCDDFYRFACGKYREKYDGAGNSSTITAMVDDFYSALKVMIDKSEWPEGSAMNKVKIVFDSCMNPGSSDARSVQDILDFLAMTGIPGWPHLDENFTFHRTPLYEILGKLTSFGHEVLFDFHGYSDYFSYRLRNYVFSPVNIRKVSDVISSDAVQNTVMTILLHLGLDTESSQQITNTFISIEKERLYIRNNASEANCTEEKIVLNCTEKNFTTINIMCNLKESILRNAMVETLYDKDQVDISCEDYHYVVGVQLMFEKYSDRDIANYIAMTVIFRNLKDLDFFLKTKLQSFLKSEIYDDFSASLDKQKKCIFWLTNKMLYPLGVMYIDQFFSNTAAEQVDNLIRKFVDASIELFLQQSWLGHSRFELSECIFSLRNTLKYKMEKIQNITKVNALFEQFHPTKSSFIINSLLHRKNRVTQILLDQGNLRYLYEDNRLFQVNAYGGFDVFLGFGFLIPPLFQQGRPDLFNIAGIGDIIGHEIGHYFFMNLEDTNVTNETLNTYSEKSKCLIDQYSTFKLRKIGKNMQGNTTLSENIPDNLGVKTMEIVSQKYFENSMNEDIYLPGLSYSPEQLLYIAMGQSWCDAPDADKENHFYTTDPHSPPEYRVIGTLQNSQKFSEVFRCSKTSYMNPEKKCITFE